RMPRKAGCCAVSGSASHWPSRVRRETPSGLPGRRGSRRFRDGGRPGRFRSLRRDSIGGGGVSGNYARIVGSGSYLPEKVVSNDELARTVDTSDAWIYSRTGIRQRHIAADHESTSDLALAASRRALAAA